jgi:hypothetical protein
MFCLCVSHRRRRPSGRPLNFSNLFFHLVCLVKTRSVATIASGPGWFLNLCVHLYTYHTIYVATSLVNKSVGPYDIYSWWFVRFRTLENHRPPVTWKKQNNNSQNKRKEKKERNGWLKVTKITTVIGYIYLGCGGMRVSVCVSRDTQFPEEVEGGSEEKRDWRSRTIVVRSNKMITPFSPRPSLPRLIPFSKKQNNNKTVFISLWF